MVEYMLKEIFLVEEKRKELKTRKLLNRKAYRIEEYTKANHSQLRFAAIGEN